MRASDRLNCVQAGHSADLNYVNAIPWSVNFVSHSLNCPTAEGVLTHSQTETNITGLVRNRQKEYKEGNGDHTRASNLNEREDVFGLLSLCKEMVSKLPT
jgi:hypothetical protein